MFLTPLKEEEGGDSVWKLEATLDLEVLISHSSLEGIKFVPLCLF